MEYPNSKIYGVIREAFMLGVQQQIGVIKTGNPYAMLSDDEITNKANEVATNGLNTILPIFERQKTINY